MKKLSALILAFFVLAFGGCTGNSDVNNTYDKTASVVSNRNSNIFISEDSDYIYYIDRYTSVKRLSKSDGALAQIFPSEGYVEGGISAFEAFNDKIYVLLHSGQLICVDKNGEQLEEYTFSPDDVIMGSMDANAFIYDNNLYFISGANAYKVKENPLELELRDYDVINRYTTPAGENFYKDNGKIFKTDDNSNQTLISADDMVVMNTVNFTDYYIFYRSYSEDLTQLNLYRIALDGSDKKLIKSIPLDSYCGYVGYDNRYIYIATDAGLVKTDKETLKEVDLSDIQQLSSSRMFDAVLEVADGKLFQCAAETYYIDTANGEKIYLQIP